MPKSKNKVTTKKVRHVVDGASDVGGLVGESMLAASVFNPELAAPATALIAASQGGKKVSSLLKGFEKKKGHKNKIEKRKAVMPRKQVPYRPRR